MNYIENKTQENKILEILQRNFGERAALPEILRLGIAQYNARIWGLRKKGYKINEESFLFVELLENLSIKRKTWGSYEKLNFIKILAVELFLNEEKELILQENKLFNLIKNINLPTLG